MLYRTTATILALLLLSLFHNGDCQSVPFDAQEISSVIEETFKCHNNPGMAVSIVKDGKTLLSTGFGVLDVDTREPVTNTSVFLVASVTKAFAASLLVKLLYENTDLTVDSEVRDFLSDFQMPDYVRTRETTFADVMGHRTAVPPHNYIRLDINFTRATLPQRLQFLAAPDQFRVKYYYNNVMYGLTTRLAELIGNKQWESLITEHFFQPLGMSKSTFATVADFSRPDVAMGYDEKQGNLTMIDPEFTRRYADIGGSGAIMTTAEDMIQWMNFHLSKGLSSTGQRVMQEEHLEEVYKARMLMPPSKYKDTRVPEFPVTDSEDKYAHGLKLGFYRGYERMSHSGSVVGYKALLTLLPEEKIGIFTALSGSDDHYAYRAPLHMYLMDRTLGLKPWLNASTICSYPEPWKPKPAASKPADLDDTALPRYQESVYEGTYHNDAYGYQQISWNQTLSALVLTYGWGTWRLYPQHSYTRPDRERFYGTGIGITALDVRYFYFNIQIESDGSVTMTSTYVTGFENTSKAIPTFDRVH